ILIVSRIPLLEQRSIRAGEIEVAPIARIRRAPELTRRAIGGIAAFDDAASAGDVDGAPAHACPRLELSFFNGECRIGPRARFGRPPATFALRLGVPNAVERQRHRVPGTDLPPERGSGRRVELAPGETAEAHDALCFDRVDHVD